MEAHGTARTCPVWNEFSHSSLFANVESRILSNHQLYYLAYCLYVRHCISDLVVPHPPHVHFTCSVDY